jgi:hypothetical protein
MAISRQQYGLGSFVKSIGKGVKKFIKSPFGKAALLGIGAFGVPGTSFGGMFGKGALSKMGGALFGTAGNAGYAMPGRGIFTPGTKGLLSKFTNMGTGAKIGIGSALITYLAGQGMPEEQIAEIKQDPEKVRPYLKDLFTKLNPNLPDGQIEEMVEVNLSEYASGGRVGLYAGSPRGGIETLDIEDEEIITPHDLKMEEGVPIQQMAGFGTDKEVIWEWRRDSLSQEMFKKDYDDLSPDEQETIEIELDMQLGKKETAPQGIQVAGGGARGWKAQEIAMDWAWDRYGKEFYDLSQELQMELYGEALEFVDTGGMAQGGRVGLESGTPKKGLEKFLKDIPLQKGPYKIKYDEDGNPIRMPLPKGEPHKYDPDRKIPIRLLRSHGGRIGLALGTEDTAQAAGILGNLPVRQNKAGVNELDLRETGGFIPPVGVKEKADDVPAMLSNNEFVWTADAVKAAGGGSVNKGAQILYDKMKQLESKVG